MNINYKESHQACRKIFKEQAKSLYFYSYMLPEKKRVATYSIYAYCHFISEGLAQAKTPGEKQTHIKGCEEILDRVYGHRRSEFRLPFELLFEQTTARYHIPKKSMTEVLTGFIFDSHYSQPANEEDLLSYCTYRGGSLGIVLSYIFGIDRPELEQAEALGIAIILTKIARDICKDAEKGRIYLPATWVKLNGLTESEILKLSELSGKSSMELLHKLGVLQGMLIKLAEHYYKIAHTGIPHLTPDGSRFWVSLLFTIYERLLIKIKKKGAPSVFSQQSLSLFEKICLVPQAYGDQK